MFTESFLVLPFFFSILTRFILTHFTGFTFIQCQDYEKGHRYDTITAVWVKLLRM